MIQFRVNQTAKKELNDRARRLQPSGPPIRLKPHESAVQFLRGVSSRATLVLPAFYLFVGSNADGADNCSVPGYAGVVLRHEVQFSSINTITLSCRKAFDHAATGLTGATFAKASDGTLSQVAEYWASLSSRPPDEAIAALVLLRSLFETCARTSASLFKSQATLCQRIGLLKQHADRSAAHLTLEPYEFSPGDCAHFVAALALVGEIIRSFDLPTTGPKYFDDLDQAALDAAKTIFPLTPDLRLFGHMKVAEQAQWCWKGGLAQGGHMLLEQLPYAIGWY